MGKQSRKRHRTVSGASISKRPNVDSKNTSEVKESIQDKELLPNSTVNKENDTKIDLQSIAEALSRIELQQKALDIKITGEYGLQTKLQEVQEETGENSCALSRLERENLDYKEEHTLLKRLVIKQTQEITQLRSEIDDLKSRSMRNNVIFHNVEERGHEICEKTILETLNKNKFGNSDPIKFERVHRLGPYNPHRKSPRPIVARTLDYKDTERILDFGRKLPRTQNGLRITPQNTQRQIEMRKKLGAKHTL